LLLVSVIITKKQTKNLQNRVQIFSKFFREVMSEPTTTNFAFGEYHLDVVKRLLLKGDGEIVALTPKVFELLLYLVRNTGRVLEKDELMTEIWADTIVEESNLSQNIWVLRGVLGEKRGEHQFIVTIPGHGYKFVADVHETPEGAALAGGMNTAEPDIFQAPASYTSKEPQKDFQNSKANGQNTKDQKTSRVSRSTTTTWSSSPPTGCCPPTGVP
jgi:DNA-binding winged helix-turn-helix (wHTH) protein